MSLLARLLNPAPASRRAYSSFFSSKPGGGRYFNSAKPPKPVVSTQVKGDGEGGASSSANAGGSTSAKIKVDDIPTTQNSHTVVSSAHESNPPTSVAPKAASPSISSSVHDGFQSAVLVHPSVNPQDFKLHQFFSLHRPLLSLSQPAPSIFASSVLTHPIFSPEPTDSDVVAAPPTPLGTLDDPPEASPEADADAARQLARALVMNRVGNTISWENTLQKLGVDVDEGKEAQAQAWAKEWEEVYMDSTRRKRKKKMKKHKLKKRRKLQRATRLRLKVGR